MGKKQGETNSESEIEIIEITPRKKKNTQKPNWFVCFFLVLADCYLGGFIGKRLVAGEKYPNRFVGFIKNVFFLITDSLPIALFVSYFLITLPTWVFVLVVASMAIKLLKFVFWTNHVHKHLTDCQKQTGTIEKVKEPEEKAKNHAKFYMYGDKYYKNRPTTLIGDFFRLIGDVHFTFLTGKNFMSGTKIERSKAAKNNIICIIFTLCFWPVVVLCFLMTVPKWLFVLAIVAAASRFVNIFRCAYLARQNLRQDIFFCKCKMKGENEWHASLEQVAEENQYDGIPECEPIDANDVKHYQSCDESTEFSD